LIACASVLASGGAFAQSPLHRRRNAGAARQGTGGLLVDLDGGKTFTARITLAAGGQLSGTLTPAGDKAIPVSGHLEVKARRSAARLRRYQPEEICETWVKSGARQATIQVDGKDASINKWQ
jgi:hypothetical protein